MKCSPLSFWLGGRREHPVIWSDKEVLAQQTPSPAEFRAWQREVVRLRSETERLVEFFVSAGPAKRGAK